MDPTASSPPERAPAAAEPYYLAHFRQVLEMVAQRYGSLLAPEEHAHIRRIRGLSHEACMLYARLANRRGPCFRRDRIAYAEIPLLDDAIAELAEHGLLIACDMPIAPEVLPLLLGCFTLPELRARLAGHPQPRPPRREHLLAWLAAWEDCGPWLGRLLTEHPVLLLPANNPWPFLRFLFFGELRDNLSDFVTRDLGFVVTETVDAEKLRPQFETRAQARDAYHMADLYARFRNMRDRQPASATLAWWQAGGIERHALAAGLAAFDRLVDRLGQRLERAGDIAAALDLYATSPCPPARERRARLLLKTGQGDAATALLRAMVAAPGHAEEAYVARQMLARIGKTARRSEARQYQRTSPQIVLEDATRGVEAATLAHFHRAGWEGVHAENWLWNAAFGLLFWDIIYDGDIGVFHSPLQRAPADLHDAGFYERRRGKIETRLGLLGDAEAACDLIIRHHRAKTGLVNPFVSWHDDLPACVCLLIGRLPPAGLGAVLRRFAQDIKRRSRGFPDLFLWNADSYRFIEVKSENDQLSAAQYQWLRFFEEAGLSVSLVNARRAAAPPSAPHASYAG